jgi:hypothetical protein
MFKKKKEEEEEEEKKSMLGEYEALALFSSVARHSSFMV